MPCSHSSLHHQAFGFRPECTITQSDTPLPVPWPEVIDLTQPEVIDFTQPKVIDLTLIPSTPPSSNSTVSIQTDEYLRCALPPQAPRAERRRTLRSQSRSLSRSSSSLAFATPPLTVVSAPASTGIPPLQCLSPIVLPIAPASAPPPSLPPYQSPPQHSEQAQRSVRSLVPYKIRCFVKALFSYGAWSFVRIANELQHPRETVRRICLETETPLSRHITTGHTSFYTSPVMRRFIDELQRSPSARRLNFTALAHRVGSTASNSTVSRYLKRHGYRRCRAKPKPFLNAATRQKRLEWAQAHAHWDASDWDRVIWTDESAFHHGGHQRTFVTRRPEEKYNLE